MSSFPYQALTLEGVLFQFPFYCEETEAQGCLLLKGSISRWPRQPGSSASV